MENKAKLAKRGGKYHFCYKSTFVRPDGYILEIYPDIFTILPRHCY
jgi:hypothetical protein